MPWSAGSQYYLWFLILSVFFPSTWGTFQIRQLWLVSSSTSCFTAFRALWQYPNTCVFLCFLLFSLGEKVKCTRWHVLLSCQLALNSDHIKPQVYICVCVCGVCVCCVCVCVCVCVRWSFRRFQTALLSSYVFVSYDISNQPTRLACKSTDSVCRRVIKQSKLNDWSRFLFFFITLRYWRCSTFLFFFFFFFFFWQSPWWLCRIFLSRTYDLK